MIPLRDENPTRRPAALTIVVIAACLVIYFGLQRTAGPQVVQTEAGPVRVPAEFGFTLEMAAVPCEVTTGQPLSLGEVQRTFNQGDDRACTSDDRTPELYPDKRVRLAVLVSMFLHGSVLHVASNMLFLWVFGNNIEDRLGHVFYALFYLAGGVAASLAHIAVQPDSTVPVVGASGAIAAVMGAYLVWFPRAPVLTFAPPFFLFHLKARWFLGIWFVIQFFTNPNSGVAWVAHVGGFVFGALVALAVRLAGGGPAARINPGAAGWDSTGGVADGPLDRRFGGRSWR
ncbi:MAG: rhomboid family intramembrane serine protease [Acidimicrobiales bacterium]